MLKQINQMHSAFMRIEYYSLKCRNDKGFAYQTAQYIPYSSTLPFPFCLFPVNVNVAHHEFQAIIAVQLALGGD